MCLYIFPPKSEPILVDICACFVASQVSKLLSSLTFVMTGAGIELGMIAWGPDKATVSTN